MHSAYLGYQLASRQKDRLTICLKCRPTAWTGRFSRRGSNLERGERDFRHGRHYQHEDRNALTPRGLDHQINVCG